MISAASGWTDGGSWTAMSVEVGGGMSGGGMSGGCVLGGCMSRGGEGAALSMIGDSSMVRVCSSDGDWVAIEDCSAMLIASTLTSACCPEVIMGIVSTFSSGAAGCGPLESAIVMIVDVGGEGRGEVEQRVKRNEVVQTQ